MTATNSQMLERLEGITDFTDPNAFNALYEDEAGTATEASQGDTPNTGAPAAEATGESSAAPAAAETKADEAVDGVLTKDGKRVIPYDVLAEARKTATTNAQRAAELAEANRQLQEQIEALKTGKPEPTTETTTKGKFSAERIAAAREDFPEMADMMEGQNALIDQLAAMRTAEAPAPRQAQSDEVSATQADIDNLPLLTRWQAKGGPVWATAVALDQQLQEDPVWSTKPQAERFAEVQRRVAEDLGIPTPSATPAPPAAQTKPPAPLAAPAPSISDFNGSSPALPGSAPLDGLAVGQAVDKAMSMTLEQIQRMVGVNV